MLRFGGVGFGLQGCIKDNVFPVGSPRVAGFLAQSLQIQEGFGCVRGRYD